MACSFMSSVAVIRRQIGLKTRCQRWGQGCFVLPELCQVFWRVGAAPSHGLQLAEHLGMQDEAVLGSLVSFAAAGVTLQSSRSVAQEIFFC